MRRVPLLAVIALLPLLAACGTGTATTSSSTKAKKPPRPVDTTCRELRTRAAAHRLALKIDYLLIAPEHESRRQVVGTLTNSLFATCRQAKLPGVANPLDYKPVKPILAQIQTDYDEEEVAGG